MKSLKSLRYGASYALLAGFLALGGVRAQTTLVPGDLFFTGYNSVPALSNDNFSFVLLRNVTAGTQITFTDKGWFIDGPGVEGFQSNANSTQDGSIIWTAPAGGVTCGTEIWIECEWSNALSATVGTVAGGVVATGVPNDAGQPSNHIEFGGAGDQLFAFQGAIATPTLIAGFDGNGGWVATTSGTVSNTQSAQPTALGVTHAPAFLTESDNYKYNCPTAPTSATKASLYTSLKTTGNWIGQNSTYYTLPTGCTWNVTDCVPLATPLMLQAKVHNAQVQLSWTAVAQADAHLIAVERSHDGLAFETVATLSADAAQSANTWMDASPLGGESWYRVTEMGQAGEASTSETVAVYVAAQGTPRCHQSAPGWVTLGGIEELGQAATLVFSTLQGAPALSVEVTPGGEMLIPVGHLPTGIYLYSLEAGGASFFGKLLIIN